MKDQILLVGAGPMAIEYAKVLKKLKQDFIVVGRGNKSSRNFKKLTGIQPIIGGLDKFLKSKANLPETAIISVSEEQLGKAALKLLKKNVKLILIEKPGGADYKEIKEVKKIKDKTNAQVYIAYNRRFYASTQKVREIIKEDGGVVSFYFEFTELSDRVAPLKKAPGVKEQWFLHNSTHVIDLAFFLGGNPKVISSYTSGSLPWHKKAAIFTGSGVSSTGSLFAYFANWKSPGRWGVEILTKKRRLILKPLEKLQVQNTGSFEINNLKLEDNLDLDFKPGLYMQLKSFLTDKKYLCTIDEQYDNLSIFQKILNG